MERRAYSEQLMSDAIELVATRATHSGVFVTGVAWYVNGLSFLSQNSTGILTFCGCIGAAVSVSGLLMNWYFHIRAERNEYRQKQRRKNPRS